MAKRSKSRLFFAEEKLRILRQAFVLPESLAGIQKATLLPPRSDTGLSVVCKRHDISRATLYVWRNRLLSGGLIRLADLPPVRKSPPPRKVEKFQHRVLEISHANPAWGCKLISRAMAKEGTPLSVASVQRILNAVGRRTRNDRCGQSGPLAPRRRTSGRSDSRSP